MANRTLENSNRLITSKVENRIIPKLIFETEKGFEVHKWEELGLVSPEGVYSTTKLQEFESLEQAKAFVASF